ncbi:carboxymuconolactone decarboxylase family protein [Citricoccus sp. GCM10030269]|uniref:carboxymuconolactone decarboxylase family protein n=1 Tax=Citricoccus sp. GCM10030269 TaxID=3273388 RepID=UPI00360AF264
MTADRTMVTERFIPQLPAELDSDSRAVYESITGGSRASAAAVTPIVDHDGRLIGPFGPMVLSPGVGDAVQRLGEALRFRGTLDPRTREFAILVVAAEQRSGFEWIAHVRAGRQHGLSPGDVESLLAGRRSGDPHLGRVERLLQSLARTGTLADETFADAVSQLGQSAVAELVWLHGYYTMLATALRVFDPPVPESATAVFSDQTDFPD